MCALSLVVYLIFLLDTSRVSATAHISCYLKLSDWNAALEHSEQVLALQPSNVKALYRRAQAHAGRLDFEEARACLLRAQRALDAAAAGSDQSGADDRQKMRTEIAAELRKVGVEMKRSETKQRRQFAGMFERMAADDQSVEADRSGVGPAVSGWASCWQRVCRLFTASTGRPKRE
jgi:tetratricopeptide (TPR) repeat protein